MERTVKSLNDEEYEKLHKDPETHEGGIERYEEFKEVKKVAGIRMNKKESFQNILYKV